MQVAISGMEVPKATTTKPMTTSGSPNAFATTGVAATIKWLLTTTPAKPPLNSNATSQRLRGAVSSSSISTRGRRFCSQNEYIRYRTKSPTNAPPSTRANVPSEAMYQATRSTVMRKIAAERSTTRSMAMAAVAKSAAMGRATPSS